jgi:uncharacterized damage-inducible protein DinB
MHTSDPLRILLAHDRWATRQILNACEPLTPAQFHQRFDMGPGSLHDTAFHIIGAMQRWSDVLAGKPVRDLDAAKSRSVAELIALHEQSAEEFTSLAIAHPLDGIVTRQREGKTWSFPRGGVIIHVATHGMHHRAQCLNMLRRLGVSPLPKSSVTDWMLETGLGTSR